MGRPRHDEWSVAARGRGGRGALGQLALAGGLRLAASHRGGARGPPSPSVARALGLRRTAGDILLRRRCRTKTRVRRREPPRSQARRCADRGRSGWHGHPGSLLRRDRGDRRSRGTARLGDPDGHRHRVRPRGSRDLRPRAAARPPDVSAHARRRRRSARHHRDRDLLHRTDRFRDAGGRARRGGRLRRAGATGVALVAAAHPGRHRGLGADARVRRARDRCRRPARLHGARRRDPR